MKEIKGLVDFEFLKILLCKSIVKGEKRLTSFFLLAIIHSETSKAVFKARLVVHEHKDKDNQLLVNDSKNLDSAFITLIASLGSTCKFRIQSHDVT